MEKRNFITAILLFFVGVVAVSAAPKIQFETETIDLGRLMQGESRDFFYVVSNSGDSELEIVEVRPTCGCTSTGKGKFKLKPGAKTTIPFTFNTGNFLGEQHKSMSVKSNDPSRPSVNLKFTAKIETIVDIEPHYLSFEIPSTGTITTHKVSVVNRYSEALVKLDIDQGDLKLMIVPELSMKKIDVKKDSILVFEFSNLFSAPLADSKYGQAKLKFEFSDGRKLEKTIGIAIRK